MGGSESQAIWDFVGLRNANWIDLPDYPELQAGPFLSAKLPQLKSKIEVYQAVPKASQDHLEERVGLLLDLADHLRSFDLAQGLSRWTNWMAEIASRKAQHLKLLIEVLQNEWPSRLKEYHQDCQRQTEGRWQPIFLTQERYYCPERSYYWGDYWIQSVDPSHRYLPNQHREWQCRQASGEKLPPYLLWLEEYSSVGHQHWVQYFSPQEQASCQIVFSEGKLHNFRGRPLTCPERQQFLFVIDLDLEVLACRDGENLCHASFTRGKPVLASGILQARDGRLNHLKFESGHYLSGPEDWWQAIEILTLKGVDWGEKLRISIFDRYHYVSKVVRRAELDHKTSFLAGFRRSR